MPKLWTESVEGHRRAVRDAVLDAAAALVAEQGPAAVTMSQVAERAGIGRATLYKYFADVDAVLVAWHERQVATHLDHLVRVRDETAGDVGRRLRAVLETFALLTRHHPGTDLAASLHRRPHVARAQRRLRDFLRDLLREAAAEGSVRSDVPPEELAGYCLHALAGAGDAPSTAAARRLVAVTLDGLRPR